MNNRGVTVGSLSGFIKNTLHGNTEATRTVRLTLASWKFGRVIQSYNDLSDQELSELHDWVTGNPDVARSVVLKLAGRLAK